jgi:hypothetical protein
MPRTNRRGVAPLNPEPRWPEGYLTVLREAGAQEKTIPHCVAWVHRFLCQTSRPQAPGLGPERNRGLSGLYGHLFVQTVFLFDVKQGLKARSNLLIY